MVRFRNVFGKSYISSKNGKGDRKVKYEGTHVANVVRLLSTFWVILSQKTFLKALEKLKNSNGVGPGWSNPSIAAAELHHLHLPRVLMETENQPLLYLNIRGCSLLSKGSKYVASKSLGFFWS